MNKTACSVLQEMMVKLGDSPHYECTAQSGPAHSAMFEYRCTARGVVGVASGGSKKEAKQESARRALRLLAGAGLPVPAPFGLGAGAAAGAGSPPGSPPPGPSEPQPVERNSVALLRDLCEEYQLGAVDFTLVGDTGPPHLRHFTMRAAVGGTQRLATDTTKKAARARAARQLYTYLKDNLQRLTGEIDESAALVRAHERAMDRYTETRDQAPRPHLGQCIADYHKALLTGIAPEKLEAARAALQSGADGALESALSALGLAASAPDCGPTAPRLLALQPTAPPLLFAAPPSDPARAQQLALRYLKVALDE